MSAQFGLIGFSHKEEGNAEQYMKEIIRKSSLLSEGNAEQNIKEVEQDSQKDDSQHAYLKVFVFGF